MWVNTLVDELNETLLPLNYFAEPHVHMGPRAEVDVSTFPDVVSGPVRDGATATLPAQVWAPPAPAFAMPIAFPDTFEVQVINDEAGPTLVAAIELVSPANKDRPEHRRAFTVKCANYLCQGVGLIIVDIVTDRHANLHDEMVGLLPDGNAFEFPEAPFLYATAYRPLRRDEKDQAEVWLSSLAVGQSLPTLPLALTAELSLPINLEATYLTACRKLRLA